MRRYRQVQSLRALCERSRRPRRSPRVTETWKQERVVALRQETGWGAKKLHIILREEQQLLLPLRDGECHPLSIVDDHSRFVVGLHYFGFLRSFNS